MAWQKIWRLAGADHMHVNGLQNKFTESDESVIASARACLTPLFDHKPCTVMPVFSSGQTAKQAPGTYAALGSTDLIFAAGGGIMAHPDGAAAGVAACARRGTPPWPGSRSTITPATIRLWRQPWRWLHERAPTLPDGRS